MQEEDLMTVKDAAAFLGITTEALYEAVHTGRIPSRKILSRYALFRQDVEAYKQRVQSDKPQEEVRKGGRPKGSTNRKKEASGEAEAGEQAG